MKTRLNYVDIARALAILSIVLIHSIAYSAHCYEIYRFVFMFSVPLFFILSGYTFNIKNTETFWRFLKRKFVRIMIPYFVWAIIFLIPYFIFGTDSGATGSEFLNIIYGNGAGAALKQNTPLWFLPALFTTEILYYFVIKYLHRGKAKFVILPAAILIGFVSTLLLQKIYLPWGINSALQIGVFFYLGYIIKNQKINWWQAIVIATAGVLAYIFNSKNNVVWADYIYYNYFLTLIAGAAFSILIIEFSKLINKNKLLEYIGKNTMSILIFHKLVVYFCQFKFGIFSTWLQNSNLAIELTLAAVVNILAILFSLAADYILTKIKLKVLLGKS